MKCPICGSDCVQTAAAGVSDAADGYSAHSTAKHTSAAFKGGHPALALAGLGYLAYKWYKSTKPKWRCTNCPWTFRKDA